MTYDMGLDRAETVVELGAGTGVVTQAIEACVTPAASVIAFELNSVLADRLTVRFPTVKVVNDSGEHLLDGLRREGRDHADAILSTLPWASLSADRQRVLLDAVMSSLRADGRFCAVSYLHSSWMPAGQRFKSALATRFGRVEESRVVWRNLPPAFVYYCR